MVRIRPIFWGEFWIHGYELMKRHAAEFNIDDLDSYVGPQRELYEAENDGAISLYVADNEAGEAIGYIAWKIGPHNGLPNQQVAHLGPWYVDPVERPGRLGLKLLERSLEDLRYRGCHYALIVLPIRHTHLRARGAIGVPFEMTYLRKLVT